MHHSSRLNISHIEMSQWNAPFRLRFEPLRLAQLCAERPQGLCAVHLSCNWPLPRLAVTQTEYLHCKPLWSLCGMQACGPGFKCLREKDIMKSVFVVLESQFVDAEDFDSVVVTGAGKLDPGALFKFPFSVTLCILVADLCTCSTGLGPPAEPFDRQRVALPARDVRWRKTSLNDSNSYNVSAGFLTPIEPKRRGRSLKNLSLIR